MRCPYKWLMCPPPNHALIHTTNSGSPAKFWFGILQIMSPWYLTVNINFQVNIFSFLTDLITKGWNASSQNVPIPTEPKTPRESDFEMLSWTLMQWSVWSVCIGNALPSDMRTIRGSQAFKVSITILTHASSKWSLPSEQVIEHEIGDEKEISVHRGAECKGGSRCGRESNFLTVFIELRCLSGHSVLCVCYSATLSCSFLTMMIMCKHCVFAQAGQARGQLRASNRFCSRYS